LSLSCTFLSAFSAALTASLSAAANDDVIMQSTCKVKTNTIILEEKTKKPVGVASQRIKPRWHQNLWLGIK